VIDEPVLFVTLVPRYSGAETAQLPVVRSAVDALVACPAGSEVEQLMQAAGAATTALPYRHLRVSAGLGETMRSIGRGFATARGLRRILRAHPQRELVYCLSLRPGLVASVASIGLRRRVVWVVPDYLPPPPLRTAVRMLASATCAATLPLSHAIESDMVGRSRRLARRTVVVHPGVDITAFGASSAEAGRRRAAVVGHVSPLKRTDLAVEIARRVRRVVPEFELDIIGSAQYRDEDFALERRLHEMADTDPELRGMVHFHPKVSAVGPLLAQSGLLLHCRDDEPFGMVLIEAMAAGLPVVAPGLGGPKEIVVDGGTGFLYPPGDDAAAAAAVIKLVGDPALARAMGVAGRQRVEELFTAERGAQKVRDVLARLADRARKP
jgi:glycosyltransferase involved in cell wall biosynthesis